MLFSAYCINSQQGTRSLECTNIHPLLIWTALKADLTLAPCHSEFQIDIFVPWRQMVALTRSLWSLGLIFVIPRISTHAFKPWFYGSVCSSRDPDLHAMEVIQTTNPFNNPHRSDIVQCWDVLLKDMHSLLWNHCAATNLKPRSCTNTLQFYD